jgi:hypothetical protein
MKLTNCYRERVVLPLWRSINSINLMLPKEERKAMLLRLFNDESDLVDNSKDRERNAAPKADNVKIETQQQKDIVGSETNGDHKSSLKEIIKEGPGVPIRPEDASEPGEKGLVGKEPNGANMKKDEHNGPMSASIHSDIKHGDTITGVLDDYENEKAANALRGED